MLDDPGPVRVLLLARSLGEWQDRLAEESAPAVADVPDADLAASAVPFFAAALGV